MKRCQGRSISGGFAAPFKWCMDRQNSMLPAVASPLKLEFLTLGSVRFLHRGEGWEGLVLMAMLRRWHHIFSAHSFSGGL